MAVSAKDQKLLLTFPRPPSGLPTPSPTGTRTLSPGPIYRASDFGFIPVGLDTEDDRYSDSLYDDPVEEQRRRSNASLAPIPVPLSSFGPTDLQLVLDNPTKLYSPLDLITGYIAGWDYSSCPSTHLHIILEGRAKVYIRSDKVEYKDRAPLLYQVMHLKPDQQGVVPRFSINIPETAANGLEKLDDIAPKDRLYDGYWTHDWPAQDPYACQPGHPLPPSMIMPFQPLNSLISNIAGRGYIEYKLIAIRSKLDSETKKLKPEASCQVPVWLTTRRLPAPKVKDLMSQTTAMAENLSVQTAALSKERRLSLREQLRDAFNASAPSFYFATSITTPKLSVPGAELKVVVSVSVLPPPAGKLYNFSIPDICIRSLNFRVRSYTGLRILRTYATKPPQGKSYTFKASHLRTSQHPPSATFRPKDGNFDKQSCVITLTLPRTLLPSFTTYNFWRSYRLESDVLFVVAGKEVTAYAQSDLNIVSRPEGTLEVQGDTGRSEMEREDEATSLEMAQAMVEVADIGVELLGLLGELGG